MGYNAHFLYAWNMREVKITVMEPVPAPLKRDERNLAPPHFF